MPDVLQLRLSSFHSLDIVRLPKSQRYRIVFAERQGVQRRAFVEVSFENAAKIAEFLLATGDGVPQPIESDKTTPAYDLERETVHMSALVRDELKKDD